MRTECPTVVVRLPRAVKEDIDAKRGDVSISAFLASILDGKIPEHPIDPMVSQIEAIMAKLEELSANQDRLSSVAMLFMKGVRGPSVTDRDGQRLNLFSSGEDSIEDQEAWMRQVLHQNHPEFSDDELREKAHILCQTPEQDPLMGQTPEFWAREQEERLKFDNKVELLSTDLRKNNPGWTDEEVLAEARSIAIDEMQPDFKGGSV